MKLKKYTVCLTMVLMMSAVLTACNSGQPIDGDLSSQGENSGEDTSIVQEAPETSPGIAGIENVDLSEDTSELAEAEEFMPSAYEPAYSAESGQAYLAIADSKWDVQYWGTATKDGYMLAYNAGIADIKGDGYYVVSVSADTDGFRFDMTGDPKKDYTPEGLGYLSVIIPDGEKLYPGAVISIDSVAVDGTELELSAKNYTISEDGEETKASLYDSWVTKPPVESRTPDGALYDEDGDPLDIRKNYSAQIVNLEDFETWKNVEVRFIISGTGKKNSSADAEPEDGINPENLEN
ncbi:MAG: hypothetical protein K2H29_09560 [Oscillospiraceae bacterium]|nr:hypothetical protein [Oscillospiraceae bacterium]